MFVGNNNDHSNNNERSVGNIHWQKRWFIGEAAAVAVVASAWHACCCCCCLSLTCLLLLMLIFVAVVVSVCHVCCYCCWFLLLLHFIIYLLRFFLKVPRLWREHNSSAYRQQTELCGLQQMHCLPSQLLYCRSYCLHYICKYIYSYGRICIHVCIYVCTHVGTFVCVYVCVYVRQQLPVMQCHTSSFGPLHLKLWYINFHCCCCCNSYGVAGKFSTLLVGAETSFSPQHNCSIHYFATLQ